MKPTTRTSIRLTLAATAALATLLTSDLAEAKRPRPQPCRPGRYLIEGAPLAVGRAAVTVDTLRVREETVSFGDGCQATLTRYDGVRKQRRGRKSAATLLRARMDGCATMDEPVHVRARIDGLCDTMKGVIRAGGKATRFTARRASGTIEDCLKPDAFVETPDRTVDRIDAIWTEGGPGSAIATAFLETARRYALGADPKTPLERDLHKRFAAMGPEGQQLLGCAARNYTTLRNLGDERLLSTEVVASDEEPVSDTTVSAGVRHELLAIADASFGQVSGCFGSERAGLPRREIIVDPDGGIQETHESPRICEVNGVRTADFLPILTRPDLGEGVLESECTVSADSRPICDVMIVDSPEECPGAAISSGPAGDVRWNCYRVPWVQQGQTVVMRGLNFQDTGIRVELRDKAVPENNRTVDAYVCGDTVTPATELVGGEERAILDCRRVNERLTFVIPDDLAPALYEVRVVMPESDPPPHTNIYVRVLLPPDATYELTADKLECVDPTNGDLGDEVALKFMAIPIGLDARPQPTQSAGFERSGFDKGDVVDVSRRIVSVPARNLGGVAIAILGHDVDDQGYYEKGIQDFSEAYEEFVNTSWNSIAQDLGTIGEGVTKALGYGEWADVVGDSIIMSFRVGIAFWKRADLIIADNLGPTQVEITELVSVSHPAPPPTEYRGADDIKIVVEPGEKGVNRYEESRVYSGNSASSTYRLFLRHNRN